MGCANFATLLTNFNLIYVSSLGSNKVFMSFHPFPTQQYGCVSTTTPKTSQSSIMTIIVMTYYTPLNDQPLSSI